MLKIILNGEQTTTEATTLDALCAELALADAKIATAHNGDFVPQAARSTILLKENDKIEIVSPRQGG